MQAGMEALSRKINILIIINFCNLRKKFRGRLIIYVYVNIFKNIYIYIWQIL